MIDQEIMDAVEESLEDYPGSQMEALVERTSAGPLAIKYVASRWASTYATAAPLHVSATPALTWGTAVYATPICFPLSSALYGRVGLVCPYDPTRWTIFDATTAAARTAYRRWIEAQPDFEDLVFTVHSTLANHLLRDRFRSRFSIDCVLFHPDQEADLHTSLDSDVWMAVSEWSRPAVLTTGPSTCFPAARFAVLVDEDFDLVDQEGPAGLPIQSAARKIEPTTQQFTNSSCTSVASARNDPLLVDQIAGQFHGTGYLHVYIAP